MSKSQDIKPYDESCICCIRDIISKKHKKSMKSQTAR